MFLLLCVCVCMCVFLCILMIFVFAPVYIFVSGKLFDLYVFLRGITTEVYVMYVDSLYIYSVLILVMVSTVDCELPPRSPNL